ncbi:hypothetical protein ACPXB3_14890 [Gordonia sp. DT219]|uniref:hypothetical protein n=1 Tax=Gordonia sp. DT219 TaxID=3416658 RepID=UPI003CF87657
MAFAMDREDIPWGRPTAADIPLPPFRDKTEHQRYSKSLALHLALIDDGSTSWSTVIFDGVDPDSSPTPTMTAAGR